MKQSLALLLVSRKKRTHSDLLAKPGDLAQMSCASWILNPKLRWRTC
jgi:hypothetical protein